MSAWRRIALERFPERRHEIEERQSIYDLLQLLEHDLRAFYRGERNEPNLAERVFDFASWCFAPEQSWDLRNAVAVGFYEHLPNIPEGRRDISARLPFETLTELHPLFVQMLEPEAYIALMAEIKRVHGRSLPSVPAAT